MFIMIKEGAEVCTKESQNFFVNAAFQMINARTNVIKRTIEHDDIFPMAQVGFDGSQKLFIDPIPITLKEMIRKSRISLPLTKFMDADALVKELFS